jgi:hypothetical protein
MAGRKTYLYITGVCRPHVMVQELFWTTSKGGQKWENWDADMSSDSRDFGKRTDCFTYRNPMKSDDGFWD